jgi:hypothetical protein
MMWCGFADVRAAVMVGLAGENVVGCLVVVVADVIVVGCIILADVVGSAISAVLLGGAATVLAVRYLVVVW